MREGENVCVREWEMYYDVMVEYLQYSFYPTVLHKEDQLMVSLKKLLL